MSGTDLIATWRGALGDLGKSWVLFEHGTCVILMEPADDLAAQAMELLRDWGPVHAGASFGDFGVIELPAGGWAVTGHHPDILTHVGPAEVGPDETSDLSVGLLGRSKRDQDAEDLRVIHVEDRRTIG